MVARCGPCLEAAGMNDVNTVYEFAQQLLAACETALGTTIGGVPDVSFVSPSLPSLDCPEMLVVDVRSLALDLTSIGNTAPAQLHRIAQRSMYILTLDATIVRCQPVPEGVTAELPDPAAIALAAQKSSQDVWAIWNYVGKLFRANGIFEGKCKPLTFDAAVPVQPSGGSAGWTFQCRMAIDGYDVVP